MNVCDVIVGVVIRFVDDGDGDDSASEYETDNTDTESESDNDTLVGHNESSNADSSDDASDDNGSDVSDDEEFYIRFNSNTSYDHVDYVMIGSYCYELRKDDEEPHTECLECQHDVMIYFINGYVFQQMMDKHEIGDLCQLHEIDISSNDTLAHLLE